MSEIIAKEPQTGYVPLVDEDIGILRRFWRGRIWYGTEWYITVFGGSVLVIMLIVTMLAPWIAPHDPNEFIGAAFTPPGGGLQSALSHTVDTTLISAVDLAGYTVGVQRNKNGASLVKELDLERVRYDDQESMLAGLSSGEVDLILVDQDLVADILGTIPGLKVVGEELGRKYPLGTDNLGRDIISRLIWGARTVLGVAITSALLSSSIGITLGLLSGFVGGGLDRVLSLVMDSLYAFPGLLLAIAMTSMLGPGLLNVAVAISVIYIPTFFRVVRGQVLSVKEELYVEAAYSLGAKPWEILIRYIFPNVIASVVVVFSLNIADTILTEAGLSFIGLGLPPDVPDWGYDLSKGHQFIVAGRWWMITFPGILITLVAVGFSLLGEGLSEILNPRLAEN